MVTLKELTPVIKTLNTKSNEVNQIIADLNAKLAKLNIGISETTGMIHASNWRIEYNEDNGLPIRRTRDVFELGYGKVNEQWELAIAQNEETQEYVNGVPEKDNFGDDEAECGERHWSSLLQASRALRIAALSRVEQLITNIQLLAQAEIESIDDARKLADKL